MQGFALVILSRPNYPHSEAFRETAETLYFGLRRCGVDVTWSDTPFTADRVPIVFGANLASDVSELPAHAVIFNLEQVENGSAWMREPYFTLLKTHEVWDYSKRNIEMLRAMGISNVRHLALGHVPEIERIPSAPRDIDVLFYGSMNPRRQRIIDELRAAGLAVTAVFGIYGAERDALIARSRIVLNVHFYDSKIFEIVRVSYLLANGACVVSEAGNDAMEQDYADVVAFAPYDGLVARCRELLADPQARAALADRGRELMRSLPQEAFLALLLNSRGQPAMPVRTQPTILNIGSGKDWKPECINIDISPEWNPDLVYDLNVVLPPEGIRFATERFGEVHLGDESCDSIVCNDVLEHLTQLTNAMNTFVRLLKPGGVLNASVPYDLSWGAWQDPTHVRAFNERSWLYYTDWFWYLGWNRWRFDVKSMVFTPSAIGQKLLENQVDQETILRTPRAIDSMRVELVKRALNAAEQLEFERRHPARVARPALASAGLVQQAA